MNTSDGVLDTSIVLHYVRGSQVAQQVEADHNLMSSSFRPFISVVTLGEIEAFALQWGSAKREKLEALLNEFVTIEVGNPHVIAAYAKLHDLNRGVNLGHNDLWIAATANALQVPVFTTDRDFLRLPTGSMKLVMIDAQSGHAF